MSQIQISKAFRIKALMSAMMSVLFFSSLSFAEVGNSLVLCKNNKVVRTLRVELGEDQKCRTIYNKQGVDQLIGSGQNPGSCEEFLSGVRKNLEEAKWNCREVKEARSSNLAPTEQ